MYFDDNYYLEHPIANYKSYDIYVDFGKSWKYFSVVDNKIIRFGQKYINTHITSQYHDIIGYYGAWNTNNEDTLLTYYKRHEQNVNLFVPGTREWFTAHILFPISNVTNIIINPELQPPNYIEPVNQERHSENTTRYSYFQPQRQAYSANGRIIDYQNKTPLKPYINFIPSTGLPPFYNEIVSSNNKEYLNTNTYRIFDK